MNKLALALSGILACSGAGYYHCVNNVVPTYLHEKLPAIENMATDYINGKVKIEGFTWDGTLSFQVDNVVVTDKNQVEAASDLGASPIQVFFKNIIPQAMPGIVSACLMTFMPTMSSYVISDVLSEGKVTLIGNYIELEFTNRAWNDGSFMALIMLLFIAISMVISQKSSKKEEKEGGKW